MSRHALGSIALAIALHAATTFAAHADPPSPRAPNTPAPATRDPESRPTSEQRTKTPPPPTLGPGAGGMPSLFTAPDPPPLPVGSGNPPFIPTAPERFEKPARRVNERMPDPLPPVDAADGESVYLEWRQDVRHAHAAEVWHVAMSTPGRDALAHGVADSAWVRRLVDAIDGGTTLDTSASARRAPWGERGVVLAVRFGASRGEPSLLVLPDAGMVQLYDHDRAVGSMLCESVAAMLDLALEAIPADSDVAIARDRADRTERAEHPAIDAVVAATGVSPLPRRGAPAGDRALERLLAPMVSADSVVVARIAGPAAAARTTEARVGHDWATHFLQALGGGAFHLAPAGDMPEWRRAAAARIRVVVPNRGMDVELLPGERAALVHVDGRTRGYVEVGEMLPRLLELASEALPKDEWLRRLARDGVTSFQGDPLPERRPQDVTPEPGEYVYVEQLPEAITKVPPVYPDAAREASVDGTVLVQALVGKDGRVEDTRIQKSIPMLDAAALASVRQWRFKPALGANQVPVAVWVAVPVKFTLH